MNSWVALYLDEKILFEIVLKTIKFNESLDGWSGHDLIFESLFFRFQ